MTRFLLCFVMLAFFASTAQAKPDAPKTSHKAKKLPSKEAEESPDDEVYSEDGRTRLNGAEQSPHARYLDNKTQIEALLKWGVVAKFAMLGNSEKDEKEKANILKSKSRGYVLKYLELQKEQAAYEKAHPEVIETEPSPEDGVYDEAGRRVNGDAESEAKEEELAKQKPLVKDKAWYLQKDLVKKYVALGNSKADLAKKKVLLQSKSAYLIREYLKLVKND